MKKDSNFLCLIRDEDREKIGSVRKDNYLVERVPELKELYEAEKEDVTQEFFMPEMINQKIKNILNEYWSISKQIIKHFGGRLEHYRKEIHHI